jgi:hypothetical protein
MMQIMGNSASCWELIAHASRTIVALGYHNIADINSNHEMVEEIHAAVAWCCQFDSVMSLLLLRPRSLPPLNIKISSLIKPEPSNPMSVFEVIEMEMIPVHERTLDLTLKLNAKKIVHTLKEEVAWLRTTMAQIYTLMDEVFHQVRDLRHELTMTDSPHSAPRDAPRHPPPLEISRVQVLLNSRHRPPPEPNGDHRPLRARRVPLERAQSPRMRKIHRGNRQTSRPLHRRLRSLPRLVRPLHPTPHLLANSHANPPNRTMLSYPLCPFFVVFCNVVGTSNAKDFQLLQDVTDGISELVSENKFVNRLHRLCTTLLELCKPVVQTALAEVAEVPAAFNADQQMEFLDVGAGFAGFEASSWNDQMMTDLFNAQPSLDWFNANVLDPDWVPGLGQ